MVLRGFGILPVNRQAIRHALGSVLGVNGKVSSRGANWVASNRVSRKARRAAWEFLMPNPWRSGSRQHARTPNEIGQNVGREHAPNELLILVLGPINLGDAYLRIHERKIPPLPRLFPESGSWKRGHYCPYSGIPPKRRPKSQTFPLG